MPCVCRHGYPCDCKDSLPSLVLAIQKDEAINKLQHQIFHKDAIIKQLVDTNARLVKQLNGEP